MKKILLCNYLFLKRSIKKVSFILMLVLMVLLCYFLKNRINEEGTSFSGGIYLENPSGRALEIATTLTGDYDSVNFFICDSLDELKKKVATNEYECGYVFHSDFDENLNNMKLDNLVDVYYSPATFTIAMTNEYVFAEIFHDYVLNELVQYLDEKNMFNIKDLAALKEELRPLYEQYLAGEETFSFEYIDNENKQVDNDNIMSSYVLLSIKGLVALFIMFAAFIGTFNLYKDENVHIFRAFGRVSVHFCKMAEIFSITLIASIVGFITLYVCDQIEDAQKDLLRFFLYLLICTIYCFAIHFVVPNSYAFAAIIPIFVLGSIIFCPIFIDVSNVIPMAKYVSYAFLPKYFFII